MLLESRCWFVFNIFLNKHCMNSARKPGIFWTFLSCLVYYKIKTISVCVWYSCKLKWYCFDTFFPKNCSRFNPVVFPTSLTLLCQIQCVLVNTYRCLTASCCNRQGVLMHCILFSKKTWGTTEIHDRQIAGDIVCWFYLLCLW